LFAPVAREPRQLTDLTPASGCQDHTISPSAPTSFVRAKSALTRPRPSHPASRVVTIAHTPLLPRPDGTHHASDSTKSQIVS
jgi:hypothetical protein